MATLQKSGEMKFDNNLSNQQAWQHLINGKISAIIGQATLDQTEKITLIIQYIYTQEEVKSMFLTKVMKSTQLSPEENIIMDIYGRGLGKIWNALIAKRHLMIGTFLYNNKEEIPVLISYLNENDIVFATLEIDEKKALIEYQKMLN